MVPLPWFPWVCGNPEPINIETTNKGETKRGSYYSASFRILNRVVHKVIFCTILVPKPMILNKMLKIEWCTFKFHKIEWCTCTTGTTSNGGTVLFLLSTTAGRRHFQIQNARKLRIPWWTKCSKHVSIQFFQTLMIEKNSN